ncbi:restriction endonuclease [Fictibacillus sp. 23RED33]|uniref:restriction endonuclease n=1 Tax=Fictibacillus sp. 23RED33 TaxID=2745879 RepID=UPI0018CFA2DB|nr:restriction endonuclease [Fictibacillus sp. 23RED33]MBH0175661.1 restriction endonuclease [Fictibacillus sp. 23RED33]
MSEKIETIYDEYIAEEKLKQGTKYEKLAAVVFKTLNTNDVVIHDLTLRGDGKKTAHQIDVTIESSNVSRRVLIECKDYDSKVGISVVRDFFGAVSQIKPDEAFVVTIEGYTRGARTFADDEGIKLAILRGFKDQDLEGTIQKIHIKGAVTFINQPSLTWVAANEQELVDFYAKANIEVVSSTRKIETATTFFYDKEGNPLENLQTVLQPIFNKLPRDPVSPTTGRHEFGSIKYVEMAGVLLGIKGFDYEFTSGQNVVETIVDQGEKIAILVFKIIDGTFDRVIFDQDLDKWTFNDTGEVTLK